MPKERKSKTPTEALTESPVTWLIGNRKFTQRPLSISGTTRLLRLLSDQISALVDTPFFASLTTMDLAQIDAQKLATMIVAMVAAVPDLLPTMLAVLLGVEAGEAAYLAEYATPVQAMQILETFLDQNEPEVLVAGFFGLGRRIGALIPKTPEKGSDSLAT